MNITISKTAALRAIAIFAALVILVWATSLALSMGFRYHHNRQLVIEGEEKV